MAAEIGGRLAVDDRGCVVLERIPAPSLALWPHGWSAEVDGRSLTLYDAGGREVAHQGDYVVSGGGYLARPEVNGWRCYPDDNQVAVIQSDVEIVPPQPVAIDTSD